MKYEYKVITVRVPWLQNQTAESWPYVPAQEQILAAMQTLGQDGWQVVEHVWSNHAPINDKDLWPVNIWAMRPLP